MEAKHSREIPIRDLNDQVEEIILNSERKDLTASLKDFSVFARMLRELTTQIDNLQAIIEREFSKDQELRELEKGVLLKLQKYLTDVRT